MGRRCPKFVITKLLTLQEERDPKYNINRYIQWVLTDTYLIGVVSKMRSENPFFWIKAAMRNDNIKIGIIQRLQRGVLEYYFAQVNPWGDTRDKWFDLKNYSFDIQTVEMLELTEENLQEHFESLIT